MTDTRETARDGWPRARDLGVPFDGETGPANAITDVPGVEVGYRTLIEGEGVRTGVTVILPRGRTPVVQPTWAGMHSFNGNGEMTGSHWVAEAGHFTGPIAITNTTGIGAAHEGLLRWMMAAYPHEPGDTRWFLPVAAETYDGYLSDIESFPVRPEHVAEAIAAASSGPIVEGNVGGGTGMQCYGFKGGSGTASRKVADGDEIVGAFVQANFGRRGELMMRGRPVGRLAEAVAPKPSDGLGSIIAILATDAPLHSRQLEGLARRATMGVARTGAAGSHGSGDIFLAFSTAPYPGEGAAVPDTRLTAFFDAAAAAVEEAILNALVAARSLTGYLGRHTESLDHDLVRQVFAREAQA